MAHGVAPHPSARRTNATAALALASFGALLAFLDVTIVNVAFPDIRQSFGTTSISSLSWVLNSYNLVFAALLVAAGRLADVFGRRRTFSAGVLVFTVASAVCAAAPGVGVLIGGRILQAVGAGLLVPASLALVIEASSSARRAHAIGLWGATAAFAAGIGPPLGGALVELSGWRLAFLVNLPLGVVALILIGRVLVESRAPGRRRLPDLWGAALLGGATALVTLGIVQGPTWGWTSPRVLGAYVGGVFLAVAFVRSSRRHPVPVLDPRLLRIPTFAVGNAVTFVAGLGFYAYLLNNILWLHYVWGYSLLRSGLAVAPGAVVAAVVAARLGLVADRFGHRFVAVPGAVIWAGAYVWYVVVVGPQPDFLGEWLPGQVVSGIGVGATLPVVASAALAAVPGGRYATASAIVSSTRQLGAVVGIALLVVIVGSPTPRVAAAAFRDGWLLSIACFVVAALLAVGLRPASQLYDDDVAAPAVPEVHHGDRASGRATPAVPRSPVLDNLPAGVRRRLLDDSPLVTVRGGTWLFCAGDPTDAMYLVRFGRLEIVGESGVVRELVAGDVVGELGLLTGAPRSAGVRARRDSQLWRVTPERFHTVVQDDVPALRALTRSLATQLQGNQGSGEDESAGPPQVVAVLGLGAGSPTDVYADELERVLAAHLRVLAARSITPQQLHRAEPEHDRIMLVAADPHDPFHAFAARQADRWVVVARSDTPPPEPPEERLGHGYVVLVGPSPGADRLVAWHTALAPRFLTVVSDADLPAAATAIGARLSGRSVGVAIAGGGARALAGIGVVEELLAAGFTVERLAGCSMGAVVAAAFASGRDPEQVDAACYDEFVRRNPFNDYRLPTVSLARGRKAEAAIARQFGGVLFEELPRELRIVSTDLLARELVVHHRGSVGAAVRASLSLPGLYPPARIGDTLHVDGGLLDNLPVRPLTTIDEGPVVAVNIAAASVRERSGPPRMPSLGETLLRTMLMAAVPQLVEARRRATVLVTPDTRGIGLLEFHQIDRAREAGRVAGRAAAEALAQRTAAACAVPDPDDGEPLAAGTDTRRRVPAAAVLRRP